MPVVLLLFYPERVSRPLDRIAWLALQVVDEAAELAESGQVAPSLGLRLALAYLHSIADGPTFALPSRRHIFDEFWRTVIDDRICGTPHMSDYSRGTMIRTCLQQIARQIGETENLFNAVRAARSGPGDAASRLFVVEALKRTDEEREQKRWRKREGYFGRQKPES